MSSPLVNSAAAAAAAAAEAAAAATFLPPWSNAEQRHQRQQHFCRRGVTQSSGISGISGRGIKARTTQHHQNIDLQKIGREIPSFTLTCYNAGSSSSRGKNKRRQTRVVRKKTKNHPRTTWRRPVKHQSFVHVSSSESPHVLRHKLSRERARGSGARDKKLTSTRRRCPPAPA